MSMRSKILWPVQQIRAFFSRCLRAPLWLLEGHEKSTGEPLDVVYTGDSERHQLYFARLAFGEGWKRRFLGREWLWRVPSRVKRDVPSCSLLIQEVSDENKIPYWGSRLLRSPVWLRFERQLEPCWPQSGPHYREIGRKIRKFGLSSLVVHKESDFDEFYHHMYVPNILKRHGDSGAIQDYKSVKKIFLSGGELIFIQQAGVAVAGGLQELSSAKSHFHSLGIRDGSESLMKLGVVEALYYFVIQRAHERGETLVSLGSCRAFFGDGVFRFKVRLGGRVGGGHNPAFGCAYFQFLRHTPGLRAFLRENPFVSWEGQKKYQGVVFLDKAPDIEALDGMLDAKHCRGLDDITLYVFDGSETKDVVTEKERRVRILPASSILPGNQKNG